MLGAEVGKCRFHDGRNAENIHFELAMSFFQGHILDGTIRPVACVVDDDIDVPLLVDNVLHCFCACCFVGYVQGKWDNAIGQQCFKALFPSCCAIYRMPLRGKASCCLFTDSARSPCYKNHFFVCHSFFPFLLGGRTARLNGIQIRRRGELP